MARSLPTPVRAKLGISYAVLIVLKRLDWDVHKYVNVGGVHVGHMNLKIKSFVIVCLFVCWGCLGQPVKKCGGFINRSRE